MKRGMTKADEKQQRRRETVLRRLCLRLWESALLQGQHLLL